MTTETTATENTVERALVALDGGDPDGEIKWWARDQEFGHSLAEQVRARRELTPRQRYTAHLMLARYAAQLGTFGLDYRTMPQPPKVDAPAIAARTVEILDEEYAVTFAFSAEIMAAIKALPDGSHWHDRSKSWRVRPTPANGVGLKAIADRYRFQIAPPALARMQESEKLTAEARAMAQRLIDDANAAAASFEVAGLVGELMPFQKVGVLYACRQRRTFIADVPGLGKTVETIATLKALDNAGTAVWPAIIVCPAVAKAVWRNHLRTWLPKIRITTLTGRAPAIATQAMLFTVDLTADAFIVNYDILESWLPILDATQAKSIVFDESHRMKTHEAKRTKAGKAVAKGKDTVLLLTGTPVLNRPDEIMAQLEIMRRLDDLGGGRDFKRRYIDAPNPNLEELNQRMRALCYIRRTKEEVLKDLPAKRRSLIPFEIDNREEYRIAEANVIRWLREHERHDTADRIEGTMAEALVQLEILKQIAAKGMLKQAIEWVDLFLDTGEKLVLFATHKAIVGEFASHFEADAITGDTSLADRELFARRFQTDPGRKLIVGNIQAAGEAITLTAASNVAFHELGWNPAVHDQAEDRVHRIGQTDSVTAWYFAAVGTIYERILKLIEAKRLVVDAVTDGRISVGGSILADLIADLTREEEGQMDGR